MALSFDGWLTGLSASGIIIFCWIFGLIWIYKGRKTNAKLLTYMGFSTFFVGFFWLQNCCDFLTILITGKNMDITTYRILNIISYMWMTPVILLTLYVCSEFIIPDKKWYIVAISGVLCVIYELFLFFDQGSFIFVYPKKSGENLIDENVVLGSPVGILYTIFMLFMLIFCGFGILIKAIQLQGILRKKYLLVSIGLIIFTICGILEGLTPLAIVLVFIRISDIIGLWIFYLGLREEPEKKEKIKPKKEVRVEGDLFRIAKYNKEDITEEEVSISKEKKIYLVCKGKVLRFNNYICPECETFYCHKCARALIDLENACWVCDAPFDESKPVKPFKKEEEREEIGISEKSHKK